MDLQCAKAAAELDLLPRRDVLVAKHPHMMIKVGAVYAPKVFVNQRLPQIEPDHCRAERRIERLDFKTGRGRREM
jgi:hypothetical protein